MCASVYVCKCMGCAMAGSNIMFDIACLRGSQTAVLLLIFSALIGTWKHRDNTYSFCGPGQFGPPDDRLTCNIAISVHRLSQLVFLAPGLLASLA